MTDILEHELLNLLQLVHLLSILKWRDQDNLTGNGHCFVSRQKTILVNVRWLSPHDSNDLPYPWRHEPIVPPQPSTVLYIATFHQVSSVNKTIQYRYTDNEISWREILWLEVKCIAYGNFMLILTLFYSKYSEYNKYSFRIQTTKVIIQILA